MFRILNGIPFVFLMEPDREYNDKLKQLALSNERAIRALPVTDGWEDFTQGNPTTARYGFYNTFLLDPITWPLLDLVRAGYWLLLHHLNMPRIPVDIESWINIHRGKDHLHRHSHYFPFIAYYSINAEGSSTIYGGPKSDENDVEIENRNGQLVVTVGFPIHHEVTPWNDDEPRITVACDIADRRQFHGNRVFVPFDG